MLLHFSVKYFATPAYSNIRPQLREKKFFERGLKLKEMIYKTTFRKEIFPNFLFWDRSVQLTI